MFYIEINTSYMAKINLILNMPCLRYDKYAIGQRGKHAGS